MMGILGTRGFFEWAIIAEDESVENLAIQAGNINALSSASEKTMREINDSLKSGIDNSMREVNKLTKEALRVGKEVGNLESKIESLNWIKPLLLLVRGGNELDDQEIKAIGLKVLRSMSSWLHGYMRIMAKIGIWVY